MGGILVAHGFGRILRDSERNDLDAEDYGPTISYGGWMQPDPASP